MVASILVLFLFESFEGGSGEIKSDLSVERDSLTFWYWKRLVSSSIGLIALGSSTLFSSS
jgi:hypothetical protein